MSHNNANLSQRSSSQPDKLDGASTRRIQGSGQYSSSDKRATLRHQLEGLRDDLRQLTIQKSRNKKSILDLIEVLTGLVRALVEIVKDWIESTKRHLGEMSDRLPHVEAYTAELHKERGELRVEIKETRKEVELHDKNMDSDFARMLEIVIAAVGPAVQAAIQGAAKATQEDRNKA